METRKRSVKVIKTFQGRHTFFSRDEFPEGTLPTKRDVIDRVLNEDYLMSL